MLRRNSAVQRRSGQYDCGNADRRDLPRGIDDGFALMHLKSPCRARPKANVRLSIRNGDSAEVLL
jgi:hypothetical protein